MEGGVRKAESTTQNSRGSTSGDRPHASAHAKLFRQHLFEDLVKTTKTSGSLEEGSEVKGREVSPGPVATGMNVLTRRPRSPAAFQGPGVGA